MATLGLFLRINFSLNEWKASFTVEWGHTWKTRVHKMFRGSNLNSSLEKCGVWLVDQWILLSICLGMIGYWLHIESFDMFIRDACLVVMFICDIDMLTTLIVSFACFNIRLFLLYDYLAFLHMYILIFVYLIHIGAIHSLYCILSCLSQHIVYSYYIPILFFLFLA